jgi:hypothetical protein
MLREWGMATPGQLVQAMADVLGIPAVTVSLYDRQLAEAGLRTRAGRGPSAANVTPTDVANLLIAILGSPVFGASIKAAAQICEEIGITINSKQTTNLEAFGDVGLTSLAALPKRHTFREALAALVEGASRGERLNKVDPEKSDFGYLEIRVHRPHPFATIRVFGMAAARERRHGLMYSVRRVEDDWDGERGRQIALGQERYIDYSTVEDIVSTAQMQMV